jgi:hypothetical protein
MTRNATHPPAVGDVNGDGRVEIVYAQEELVVAVRPGTTSSTFGIYMTEPLSGSPTLADFDLDGDVEVVVPLENGELHLLGDLGGEWPGFPFSSPTGVYLTAAALGNLLGNSVPEIVTAALSWNVHVIMADGTEPGYWPVDIGVTLMYGSPVIGEIEGASADVIIANTSSETWAWNNFGDPLPGWPRPLDCQVVKSPAMGDIDLDGSGEIVLLGRTELIVFDVNKADTHPYRSWPMAAHDPQRTGCYNCPEDLVTPVEDDPAIVTRVSFAAPAPNPSSGATTFRFAVPGPAVVNLEVFDVRGHRVSLVTREEVGVGSHVASWGGLGDNGENLASGVYFARLRVEGPDIREELTRKITLAR